VVLLALRADQPEDEHVLGHPAFPSCLHRGDAQRKTLFPQQGIAAIARAIGPDQVLLWKVADVLFLHGSAGPRNILLPLGQRSPHRMQARRELAVGTQCFNDGRAHPRHDVHVAHHIGAIRDLDADLGHG